ncbi:MAG TPA: 16S rRNA processing protein RimM [Dehalococcoidia bacterium]|nr:16S rRNA processing protein RimM [Dehalococcoidia bacterium]HIN24680.1 16S rRNA processing protein RimM [Dehalococcoidia bacterium]
MSDSSTPADHSLVPTSDLSSDVLVAVGRIIGAHGREGEIRVKATSDVPGRFDEGQTLYVSRDGVSPEERTYQIAKTRPTGSKGKDILIISLRGCRDRDQALRMAGLWLCVLQSEVPSAEEGEYFHYELLGLKVRTVEGEDLGEVAEILETGSNDVYVVRGAAGEILVPALSKVVREIDIASGLMVVDLPEGLR